MASYPAEFSDETGAVRLAGSINFPDPDNQPQPGDVFTGWTSDAADPADVSTSGGNLDLSTGSLTGAGELSTASTAFKANATGVGFYDTTPISQPVVPLTTPLPQDIIDALVALGLVSQSD